MRARSAFLILLALVVGFLSGQVASRGIAPGPVAPGESGPEEQAESGGASTHGGPSFAMDSVPASAELRATAAPASSPIAVAASGTSSSSPATEPMPEGLSPEETRNIEIFRRSTASVVFITNIGLRRDIFSMDVFQVPQGTGSGFVWDAEGRIVTNFHVIENGQAFAVTLADQSTFDAEVVGVARDKDLAVLRINAPASKLVPLPLGRSQDLAVGQTVLAVGNPFGLDHSLTVGVVSALGRELQAPSGRTIRDIIQTDAAINPGNSGGPLLDSRGRLVGVNSAIYSPSGAFAGIGFAVPVDTVAALVPQIIKYGKPIRPGIGVNFLSRRIAARMSLEGLVIYQVASGSPAEAAGLKGIGYSRSGSVAVGDQIISADGQTIETSDDLQHVFEGAGVGKTVTLTVMRDGRTRAVDVKLSPIE